MSDKRNRNKGHNAIEKAQRAAQEARSAAGEGVESVRDLPPSNVLGSTTAFGLSTLSNAADATSDAASPTNDISGGVSRVLDVSDVAQPSAVASNVTNGDVESAGRTADVASAVKVDRADSAVPRNTGAVRNNRTVTSERTVWEPRPYPKWWLVVPSVAGVVGLVAWQMNGIRNKQERDLEDRSLVALRKKFPNAGLEFKGRDATLRGLTASERAEAERIIRNVDGVRAVTFDDRTPAVIPQPSVVTTSPVGQPTTTLTVVTDAAPASASEDTFAEPPAGPSTTVRESSISEIATPTVIDAVPEKSIPETDSTEVANDTAPATMAEIVSTTTAVPKPIASGEARSTTERPEITAAPAMPIASAPPMRTISFGSSSAVLGVDGADLQEFADFLIANPDARIAVSGHADSSGSKLSNLALSQERADAVREALIRLGVNPEQITAKGFGSRSPIASNDTFSGRTKNRRVELRIVGARDSVNFTG